MRTAVSVILIIFVISNIAMLWIYISEAYHNKRGTRCDTCGSTKKKVKGKVRYFLSEYLWNDDLCNDDWHNN